MPNDISANLANIYASASYERVDTLRLYLSDGTAKHLSRGAATRDGQTYKDYIRSVSDLVKDSSEVSRLTIECQNINSELGLIAASDLRLLDFAVADYGRIYKSKVLTEDLPQIFRSVLADVSITETMAKFDLVTDYEALGAIVASRSLAPPCSWKYKSGRECTSSSIELTCPKTRFACKKRGNQHEFGGWEFFDDPTDSAPGAGGNVGGIGNQNPNEPPCFSLNTDVRLLSGTVRFGELPVGVPPEPIYHYSFNEFTGEIEVDEIEKVFEHETVGYFTLDFGIRKLDVTGEHPLFVDFGEWRDAGDFQINQTMKFHIGGEWRDLSLRSIKWHSDDKIPVRNLRSKKNKNYLANGGGAHNVKTIYEQNQS